MVVLVSLLLLLYDFLLYSNSPIRKIQTKKVLTIEVGENTNQIIKNLQKDKLITKPYYFKLLFFLKKRVFKAGGDFGIEKIDELVSVETWVLGQIKNRKFREIIK